jgi:tetratricopeptide (TPR) repeat protein
MENDPEHSRRLIEDAIAAFPVGEGTQAGEVYRLPAGLPGLHRESMALLGICAALDCDGPVPHVRLEQAAHWLDVALESGWLDVDISPESARFPLRILAWRALMFADRLQALSAQIQLEISPVAIMELAATEAALECGSVAQEQLTRLTSIDPNDCPPLSADAARLWQTWLQAEYTWWFGGDVASILPRLEDAIRQPDHPDWDGIIQAEARRLKHRATLFLTRFALGRNDGEQARRWLDVASGFLPEHWETHYMAGMLAWFLGDTKQARRELENSLNANPFQQRVRFELDVLRCSAGERDITPEMPGVMDALADTAMQLFRSGRLEEARRCLEWLDQPEGPFSMRLILPQARRSRIQQAWSLRAHLAESAHDWENALQFWQTACRHSLSQNALPLNDEERAHHLFLLGRTLGNTQKTPEDPAKREAYIRFQRELGMLSNRTQLSDNALFYINLAAWDDPSHTVSDWQKLLRATEWMEMSLQRAPGNLICLGDRLWRGNQLRDAWKAYIKARCGASDPERWSYVSLVLMPLPTPNAMLDLLSQAVGQSIPPDRRALLCTLCLLAQQPANVDEAQRVTGQASQEGLPLELEQIVKMLLASFQTKTFQKPVNADVEAPRWLTMLHAGMELLFSLRGLQSLSTFRAWYGSGWLEWCPVNLVQLFGNELQTAIKQQDMNLAETLISSALEMGIQLHPAWKARVDMLRAIMKTRQNDFSAAQQALQRAKSSLFS